MKNMPAWLVKKNVLIVGSCEYEAVGVSQVFTDLGFRVLREASLIEKDELAFVVVALSSEPILGWSKNMKIIKRVLRDFNVRVLVLVPEQLSKLTLLKSCCSLINGYGSMEEIKKDIIDFLNIDSSEKYHLALDSVHKALVNVIRLKDYSPRGYPVSNTYYRRYRMLKSIGLDNIHLLNLFSGGDVNESLKPMIKEVNILGLSSL